MEEVVWAVCDRGRVGDRPEISSFHLRQWITYSEDVDEADAEQSVARYEIDLFGSGTSAELYRFGLRTLTCFEESRWKI